MITWIKPSGIEITTNDKPETVAYCESLGWKRKGDEKPERAKPGPKPKAKDAE